ncbi:flagellin [Candidatus Paracaedibacter symbiosus]|uniref:flagellin n=1 Tax=Candidatus Paracaedibacter symbiosus TaxID=244582 RepID=UPI000509CE17|nr:flagellin [Candidatus Paracaedibacter symbiosus]
MVSSVTNLGANAARRYIDVNSAKANTATQQLASGINVSNPSYDPSSAAVGYSLSANIASLQQASRNVSQATSIIQLATGFLGASQDVLTRMKQLTVAANSGSVSSAELQMMNQEFQKLLNQIDNNANNARWAGISLFSGGGGTVTAGAAVVAAPGTVAGGSGAVGTYFGQINTAGIAGSQGMITGVASDATVTANGALFDISITVGNQTFKGTTAGAAAGTVILTSATDSGNSISLPIAAAFGTAAATQTDLQTVLGIPAGLNAVFSSANTTAGGMAGVTSVTAGAGTTAGAWALSYTVAGGNGSFKITNGTEVYTSTATATGNIPGSTVTFTNGMTLNLAAGFASGASIAQEIYDVSAGTSITQSFQYAEKSTDVLQVTFTGANVAALQLSGQNILNSAAATLASNAIDAAAQTLGSQIGTLGGQASEFKFMTDTLRINIENSSAAKSTFTDADIAQSMEDLQTYNGLGQISQTVFTKALNDQSNLVQMVQGVR